MNDTFLTYEEFMFVNEADDAAEKRIDDLAKDSEVHKKLGISDSGKLKHAFMVLFKRGYGAAQTNWAAVRPQIKKLGKPAAYIAWGYGRLNGFIDKSKAYYTSDKDVADWLEGKGEKPEPK
jgi:hypothetical protein